MGIQFFMSDTIAALKEPFIEDIFSTNTNTPFIPSFIIVPNINVKKWIQLEIARQCGIACNLDIHYLEEGLIRLMRDAADSRNDEKYIFLGDKEHELDLHLMILAAIERIGITSPAMAPVFRYINGKGESNSIDSNKRRWQLAEKLSYYFREYEYQRVELIAEWEKDNLFLEPPCGRESIEEAQKTIYRKIFVASGGTPSLTEEFSSITGEKYTTLPRYAAQFVPNRETPLRTVYIFGLSQISAFHFGRIIALSDIYDFHIYQQNFLELFARNKTHAWDLITVDQTTAPVESNPLIKNWSRPSVENLKIFKSQLAGHAFQTHWIDSKENKVNHTLLSTLQCALRHKIFTKKKEQDRSLQIFGAQSLRREVELVLNAIIANMRDDPALRLTDIAVLVPDMELYRHHLRSVFDGAGSIRYNLSDTTAGTESIFADALITALNIAGGTFSRPDITKFLLNPCVMYTLGLDRATIDRWIILIDRLHIYYSYDREDKKEVSTAESNLFTWENGLKRMRLGYIMGNSSREKIADIVPYADLDTSDRELFDQFVGTLEKLFAFFKSIRREPLTGNGWKEKLIELIEQYIKIPPDMKEEESVRESAFEILGEFEKFDRFLESDKIDLVYISSFIKNHISEIPAVRGKYLSDGVTISKLTPMKPIPFKIVFIMGLGEGRFPGHADKSTLDLRNAKRLMGDITKSESDTYLFLELLLSVREKLYLSYVCRNIEKDETLYPSPVLTELVEYVNEYLLEENKYSMIATPLTWESRENFIQDRSLTGTYTDLLGCFNDDKRLMAYLTYKEEFSDPQIMASIEERYKSKTANYEFEREAAGEESAKTAELTLYQLKCYLDNPARARIRFIVNIDYEEGEDLSIIEEEPFAVHPARAFTYLKEGILGLLTSEEDGEMKEQLPAIKSGIGDTLSYTTLKGELPEGVFGKVSIDTLFHKFDHIAHTLRQELPLLKQLLSGAAYREQIDIQPGKTVKMRRYAPPVFARRHAPGHYTITGKQRHCFVNENEYLFLAITERELAFTRDKTHKLDELYPELLQFFLFYGLLSAVESEKKQFTAYFVFTNGIRRITLDRSILSQFYGNSNGENDEASCAVNYLKMIAESYLNDTKYDLMPLRFLIANYKNLIESAKILNDSDFCELYKEEIEEYLENEYNQLDDLTLLTNPVVPPDIRTKILDRTGILGAFVSEPLIKETS